MKIYIENPNITTQVSFYFLSTWPDNAFIEILHAIKTLVLSGQIYFTDEKNNDPWILTVLHKIISSRTSDIMQKTQVSEGKKPKD